MNRLYFLVGLPGSGKSTYAQRLIDNDPSIIWISSDAIREELWGDANDQQQPGTVFGTMFQRTAKALSAGQDVIYDATNINAKTRASTLIQLRSYVSCEFEAVCVMVLCSLSECKRRQNDRERKVPEECIDRMVRQFQAPWYNEGWDRITTVDCGPKQDIAKEHIRMSRTPHDNPHHTSENLNAHCLEAVAAYNINADIYAQRGMVDILREAAFQHDLGKYKTKAFRDTKGNPTDIAHYYSHDNVGAYLWLTGNEIRNWSEYDFLLIAVLIQWHMQPYFLERDKSKLDEWCIKRNFGVPFSDWIWIIHQADKAAH